MFFSLSNIRERSSGRCQNTLYLAHCDVLQLLHILRWPTGLSESKCSKSREPKSPIVFSKSESNRVASLMWSMAHRYDRFARVSAFTCVRVPTHLDLTKKIQCDLHSFYLRSYLSTYNNNVQGFHRIYIYQTVRLCTRDLWEVPNYPVSIVNI